jgi:hypothetical protein
LKKRRVDQYKRMQLNPEATLACCHHLLTVPDLPLSNHRTCSATGFERLREAHHVKGMPPQRSFLNLHRFAQHAETVQPRSHHPRAMPIRGRLCIYRRAVCGLCGGGTQEPAQPLRSSLVEDFTRNGQADVSRHDSALCNAPTTCLYPSRRCKRRKTLCTVRQNHELAMASLVLRTRHHERECARTPWEMNGQGLLWLENLPPRT